MIGTETLRLDRRAPGELSLSRRDAVDGESLGIAAAIVEDVERQVSAES